MSKNKVTMKDIAKECGVSLATVSYVLNNYEKEHISHPTRIKVLETARRLNYVPHLPPRSLTTAKSNLIGILIYLKKDSSQSKRLQYYDLAAELQKELEFLGYDVLLSITDNIKEATVRISKRLPEAIFIIDINTQEVKQLTQKCYFPVIFIDCEINDPLFCRIYPDYNSVIASAKKILETNELFLVMEDMTNAELKDIITRQFDRNDIFINQPECRLRNFLLTRQNKKGLILGDILGLEAERYINNENIVVATYLCKENMLLQDTRTISIKNRSKAKAAAQTLKQLLSFKYEIFPKNQRLLPPDAE